VDPFHYFIYIIYMLSLYHYFY